MLNFYTLKDDDVQLYKNFNNIYNKKYKPTYNSHCKSITQITLHNDNLLVFMDSEYPFKLDNINQKTKIGYIFNYFKNRTNDITLHILLNEYTIFKKENVNLNYIEIQIRNLCIQLYNYLKNLKILTKYNWISLSLIGNTDDKNLYITLNSRKSSRMTYSHTNFYFSMCELNPTGYNEIINKYLKFE
jgi:hypothetical protein